MRHLLIATGFIASAMIAPAQAQETISCLTNYRTTSQASETFPGTLATAKDTPCRHSRSMSGKARGAAPGQAAGFDIVKAPKNGKVTIEDASTFLFTPKKGFAGSDEMVLKLKYMNGDSATVRFAITVS
jgi:Bacterial Ig domain